MFLTIYLITGYILFNICYLSINKEITGKSLIAGFLAMWLCPVWVVSSVVLLISFAIWSLSQKINLDKPIIKIK